MDDRYTEAARHEWTEARRKALWSQLRANLSREKLNLIDFREISQRFDLGDAAYRGVQSIPLAKIVGSAGRYQDFLRTFLPAHEDIGDRWQQVARLYFDPASRGWPPIEVYQVGEGYFVIDGNHRVSVAQQLKLKTIEAHIIEFSRPVAGLAPGVDMDTLLLEAERQDFLQKTRLDELRPGHTLCLTAPGGYREILGRLVDFQQLMSRIDQVEISFAEAVTTWYDLTYSSTVLLIEASGVLAMFPDRTAADFFVWVLRHQQKLEEQYGQPVSFDEAFGESPPPRFRTLRQAWRLFWRRLKPQRPPRY